VPLTVVEPVLVLYRDRYPDLSVQHFHEKLRDQRAIKLSYRLGEAGLAECGFGGTWPQAGTAAALPGMLLHIDGSRHRWFQDERWYDLIVILDDATSEIYYAQLVEEEPTVTAGLQEVIERKGLP